MKTLPLGFQAITPPLRLFAATLVAVGLATVAAPATAAGYGFDPSRPRDEKPGNVYFGSAKDGNGNFLPGVSFVLQTAKVDYVFVTDATGRFRLELADEVRPEDVKPRCSREGFPPGRIIKRPPPGGALTPVQVDCVLER